MKYIYVYIISTINKLNYEQIFIKNIITINWQCSGMQVYYTRFGIALLCDMTNLNNRPTEDRQKPGLFSVLADK